MERSLLLVLGDTEAAAYGFLALMRDARSLKLSDAVGLGRGAAILDKNELMSLNLSVGWCSNLSRPRPLSTTLTTPSGTVMSQA